ncbi:MAG: hypothetical protein RIR65_14 [Planctomycetota bacterium]
MLVKYLLPILSLCGLAFAIHTAANSSQQAAVANPVAEPARAPFAATIAGAGIVEARSRNIAIGAQVGGVVARVGVDVGSRVKAGDLLFSVDDRKERAAMQVAESAVAVARAELARLAAQPRAEDLPPWRAAVAVAEAQLAEARTQLALVESVVDKRAVAQQELDRRRSAVAIAEARLAEARSDLDKASLPAWEPELAMARARLASSEASVAAARADLELVAVRSPIDGVVLQVEVRPGEYAPAGASARPLLLLGDLSRLHVRVDIDESDAWRFKDGAAARAFVRGNRELAVDLEFVRSEPYVLPKRSLTGESTERVDTRVLQVVYAFDPARLSVRPGMQMDVFVDAGGGQ